MNLTDDSSYEANRRAFIEQNAVYGRDPSLAPAICLAFLKVKDTPK